MSQHNDREEDLIQYLINLILLSAQKEKKLQHILTLTLTFSNPLTLTLWDSSFHFGTFLSLTLTLWDSSFPFGIWYNWKLAPEPYIYWIYNFPLISHTFFHRKVYCNNGGLYSNKGGGMMLLSWSLYSYLFQSILHSIARDLFNFPIRKGNVTQAKALWRRELKNQTWNQKINFELPPV